VLDGTDEAALRAFRSTWFLRTILKTEHHIVAEGGQICFIRIRPDPVVFTHGFGMSLRTMRRHAGKGARRVPIRLPRRGKPSALTRIPRGMSSSGTRATVEFRYLGDR
jgi:pimeloyl-ACP methyl ester carboxylesterase